MSSDQRRAGAAATGNSAPHYAPGGRNLPAERSTATKPALLDHAADYDIPRLWWDRDVDGNRLTIFRALTDGERSLVERRRAELELGCAPFAPAEHDRVVDAVAAMLDGFRSLRHQDISTAAMGVEGLCRLLARYPLWAIEQGCLAIQGGEATLGGQEVSRKYPPNDAEIRSVIAEIVKPYLKKRDAAVALLAAPVKEEEPAGPKPTLAELEEKYWPNFGLQIESAPAASVDVVIPRIDASKWSAEDLERLAGHLKRSAA